MTNTILCYGDSNTWGVDPTTGNRLPPHVRWPGVLKEHLGKDFCVIEEGLKGRTTAFDDPVEGKSKNGRRYLKPCLASHAPLALVIIMLGSNDMKKRFSLSVEDIAKGMERLMQSMFSSEVEPTPELLLLSPIPFGPNLPPRFEGAEKLQKDLGKYYEKLAKKYECAYLETGKFVSASPEDPLHLNADGHRRLGTAISAVVNTLRDC